MKIVFSIIIGLFGLIDVLGLYACLRVSSQISRIEEQYKNNEKDRK